MASAPKPNLPLFYKDLMPLNSRDHGSWKSRKTDSAMWIARQHAVPLTVDEFAAAQRHFPIIFSMDENPVPLALMGLNEGVNTFFDDEGKLTEDAYLPAYARRYPFLLARIDNSSENMTLCFDPSAGLIGEFEDGEALFENDKPTQITQEILGFCEKFEEAGRMTGMFVEELKKHELLMDGEVAIQRSNEENGQPFIYRGFKMINQDKLKEVRGDVLRGWAQNGMLPLIYAHLMSLDLMRVIFGRQMQQGKVPQPAQPQAAAPVA